MKFELIKYKDNDDWGDELIIGPFTFKLRVSASYKNHIFRVSNNPADSFIVGEHWNDEDALDAAWAGCDIPLKQQEQALNVFQFLVSNNLLCDVK